MVQKEEVSTSSVCTATTAFVCGIALGAAAAAWISSSSGKKFQKTVRRGLEDGKAMAEKMTQDAVRTTQETIRTAQEFANELAEETKDRVKAGKDRILAEKQRVEAAIHAGKEAYAARG